MEIIAIIPARGGSKGIPQKNIRPVAGKPLLAWSIQHALESKTITRVIVSTDSSTYADIAKQYGAEVPFLRPDRYAQDDSTDHDVFFHTLEWLRNEEGYEPDICVHLRPTCPVRRENLIDSAVTALIQNPTFDSVRTIAEVEHTPYKMWELLEDGKIEPILSCPGIPEAWNMPRQALPKRYIQTANVDVVRSSVILHKCSMTGQRILGFVEDEFCDIDSLEELVKADELLKSGRKGKASGKRTFCFDIDGVIATLTPGNDYSLSGPQVDTIERINKLAGLGHKIILFTARGSMTGIDWEDVTRNQMEEWGVCFDELKFGKPAADFYIDDKNLSLCALESIINQYTGDE